MRSLGAENRAQSPSRDVGSAAIAAVAGGLSERKATKAYGVSRGPLHQRINGRVPLEARTGTQLDYTTEGADRGVVEMVRYRALRRMCVEFEELRGMLQLLDIDRASASTADVVSHYFNNPQRVMKKLDLSDKPNRIWNCDETPLSNLLQVTERQNRVLRELDLNVDALNVVNLLRARR
uniref:HTH psq-type domain-containing protein n=1 Tax=Phytophthora ramorum TaxID=164328 RepID=H3GT60_PHYRM